MKLLNKLFKRRSEQGCKTAELDNLQRSKAATTERLAVLRQRVTKAALAMSEEQVHD